MTVEIINKEDLQTFKREFLAEVKSMINEALNNKPERPEGYKTKDVRRILGCCYNTLLSLRIQKKIRAKKILGTWYYNKEDVKKLLEEGFK